MANVNTKAHVLVRDVFRCRYCAKHLYLSQAVKILDQHIPGLELWDLHGKQEPLRTQWATVDHVISETEGGMDILENLVACCVCCNSRKGGTTDAPLPTASEDSSWDGLSGLFVSLADSDAASLSTEDHKWLAALRREQVTLREQPLLQGINEIKQFRPLLAAKLDCLLSTVLRNCRDAES